MTKNEMKKYIGTTSQLFGIRDYTMNQGKARGMRGLDVNNGTGLDFTVLPDRGMDISRLSYKGTNYSYISSSGISSPQYFDDKGLGFLRNFYAGFLTTCGLSNVGSPCVDEGEEFGLHGRIANIPADEVCSMTQWIDDKAVMRISGILRESRLFGENLVLKREILCRYGENRIKINDHIENEGFSKVPFMILYHFNFGYPLLDENARLITSETNISPRDQEAAKGIAAYSEMQPPKHNYMEQVFYHDLTPDENNLVYAGLVNEKLGHGVKISFKKNQLSRFTQWKQMGEGAYVLGLEPCNCPVEGRAKARHDRLLEYLEPGETRKVQLLIDMI